MRFAATIFATLLAASAVVAQGDIPACLGACSTSMPTSCPDAKDTNAITKCGCEDEAYRANSTACLEVTCTSAEEFAAAQKIAVVVCAQQGVSITPEGTWKGPGGGSSASQTSTDSASTPSSSNKPDNAAFSIAPALVALLGSVALALAL